MKHDPIATLRGLLAAPPSPQGCDALYKLLSRWPDDGTLTVGLSYAHQHLDSHQEQTPQPTQKPQALGPQERYLLGAKIPSGAMSWSGLASVSDDYLSWDQERQERCIVRIFPAPDDVYDMLPGFRELKTYTAQTIDIVHPHVLPLYESHFATEPNYVVMACVPGPNLRQVIPKLRREGTTTEQRCISLAIGLQVLDGLHAAHTAKDEHGLARPLSHGQVRPKCIQLSTAGVCTIANFGMWEVLGNPSRYAFAPDRLTPYESPEQLRNPERYTPDARSDLFQVGILLYELLLFQHPFQGKTELHSLRKLYDGQHKAPQQIAPELPAPLAALLTQALAHQPADRFASAAAMRDALNACYQAETSAAPETHIAAFVQRCFAKEALLTRYACLLSLTHEELLPLYWSPPLSTPTKATASNPEEPTIPGTSPRVHRGQPVGMGSLLSGVWRMIRGQS